MSWSLAFIFRIDCPDGGTGFTTFPGWRTRGACCASFFTLSDSGKEQRSLFWRFKNRDDDLRNLLCGEFRSAEFWEPRLQLVSPLPAKRDQSGSSIEGRSNANLFLLLFLRVCSQVLWLAYRGFLLVHHSGQKTLAKVSFLLGTKVHSSLNHSLGCRMP